MPITEMLPGSGKGWRRWGFAAASLVVHTVLIAALVAATEEEGEAAVEPEREEVTYVDISQFAPPPPPPPAAADPQPATQEPQRTEPRPTEPRPEPRQPRPEAPPRAADIVEPEDSVPEEPIGADVPPRPLAPPVTSPSVPGSVAPVSGGRAGGQAGGVEGGVEGGKPGGVVGGQGEAVPDPGGTYVAAVVDRQASLSNRRELSRILQRLYPSILRDSGVGGRVVVQFVVGTNGRVDMSTVKIMSSTHDGFEDPTRDALREFRFRAAQMGDTKVRMLTQMPIVWEVQ